ncbi:MAG TPA: hypothetical protein DEG69_11690 [Flavobacteriaceae bacterium]|nr:hypothetical protein [Flavobacteriaceae bacterium]
MNFLFPNLPYVMLLKNYYFIFLARTSKTLGKGKYFRKKLFSARRILELNFPADDDFSFLQIGANDGVSFDFLHSFVMKRKSSGIVLEPVKDYFDELCENYKTVPAIIKINRAIHRSEKSIIIYKIDKNKTYLYPDWVKGIASFNVEHLTKFESIDREHIIEEKVLAEPLMNIIERISIPKIDYFQVDTEGYDYHVVDLFDFSKYKPRMIKAEYINLKLEEKKKMKKKLKENGYFFFFEGLDIVGMDLNTIKL